MELLDSESRRRNSTTRRKKKLGKENTTRRTEPRGSAGLESSERGQQEGSLITKTNPNVNDNVPCGKVQGPDDVTNNFQKNRRCHE